MKAKEAEQLHTRWSGCVNAEPCRRVNCAAKLFRCSRVSPNCDCSRCWSSETVRVEKASTFSNPSAAAPIETQPLDRAQQALNFLDVIVSIALSTISTFF